MLGNSNSELELTPELPLFSLELGWSWSGISQLLDGVGAELQSEAIVGVGVGVGVGSVKIGVELRGVGAAHRWS